MNEDFQNQPSVMLAKEADPSGQRTLGVLTKPDRVEEGVFENWKPVLEGKEQRLHHGYYVVKNPSFKQLNKMNHEQARAAEQAFFLHDKWTSLGSHITSRLGSDRLAMKLASLLEQIIKIRLPNIVKEVKSMHNQVKKELSILPGEIKEAKALASLNSMIREFHNDFRVDLLENQEEGSMVEDVYELTIGFWKEMLDDRPLFLPITRPEIDALGSKKASLHHHKKLIHASQYLFEDDKLDLKARDVVYGGAKEIKGKEEELWNKMVELAQLATANTSAARLVPKGPLVLTLSELKQIKARATRDLLPNNTPWRVKAKLIELSIANWPLITLEALKKIEERVLKGCNELIAQHFERFQAGNLEATISRIMENFITNTADSTKDFLLNLVRLESRYTTINTQDFVKQQGKLTNYMFEARKECQFKETKFDANGYSYEGYDRALEDSVNEELELVAEIRAYWQLAFKRFTDNARSAFQVILVEAIARNSLEAISEGLDMYDEDASKKAKSFLQEDPNIVQIRASLAAKEATLAQGLEVINAFSTGSL